MLPLTWPMIEAALNYVRVADIADGKLYLSTSSYANVPREVRGYWAHRIVLGAPVTGNFYVERIGRTWTLRLRDATYLADQIPTFNSPEAFIAALKFATILLEQGRQAAFERTTERLNARGDAP